MSVFDNAVVVVTGITGTFGKAFARYALEHLPVKAIRGVSRSEIRQAEMRGEFPDPRLRLFLADVRDQDRLELTFRGADIVIHAAALKRLDNIAYDPGESIRTNVMGMMNVEAAARRMGIQKVFGVSSDKGVVPANLYGATKLLMEHYFSFANHYSAGLPTKLACGRWGNILSSTGSVLTIWQAQAARGEPLTVTDPRMTRYFLPITHAIQFVVRSIEEMRGGEVFVPKMTSGRVVDLAEAYLPGYPTKFTSIRPGGEKLHEDILTIHEARHTYDWGWGYVVEPEIHEWDAYWEPKGRLMPEDFSLKSSDWPASVEKLHGLLREAGWS